jgi:DNA-binding transcriptional LysR family regulator
MRIAFWSVAMAIGHRREAMSNPSAGTLLEPLIASFCQAYPEVEVEIGRKRRAGRPRCPGI